MNYKLNLIATLVALMSICPGAYGEERPDTVKVIREVRDVVVMKRGNTTRLTATLPNGRQYQYEMNVEDADSCDYDYPELWGMELPFIGMGKRNYAGNRMQTNVTVIDDAYFGWRFNYDDKQHVKNGFETGVRSVIGVNWRRGDRGPAFAIGLGFGMKRFFAEEGFSFSKSGDNIRLVPVADGLEVDHSRLDIWTFHIPVTYRQPIGKVCSMTLGAVANLNTYASGFTSIRDGRTFHKRSFKGLQQNLFTADLTVSFSIRCVGIYSTWSPMKLFSGGYGPNMRGWSMGITLF